jgi:hypothetical protein
MTSGEVAQCFTLIVRSRTSQSQVIGRAISRGGCQELADETVESPTSSLRGRRSIRS